MSASPPSKRARIDNDGPAAAPSGLEHSGRGTAAAAAASASGVDASGMDASSANAHGVATSAHAIAEESMRQMLERSAGDTASRSTLHFPAAIPASGSSVRDSSMLGEDEAAGEELPLAPLAPFPVADDWSYVGARVLAPMVRISTLPMRRLAAEMGATMVYSEELVALKLRHCRRVQRVDERGRTFVDFVPGAAAATSVGASAAAAVAPAAHALQPTPLNSAFITPVSSSSSSHPTPAAAPAPRTHNQNMKSLPVLTTFPGERLVVQLGAAAAVEALAAAQVVAGDAREINVNMGCPKHFSLQGGMGAALLSKPERAADILGTLRRNINLPITCKIRLLHTDADTVELVRRLESMGVSAIACHARHIEDRPRHRAMRERIGVVADALRVPLLYNGDVFYAEEIEGVLKETRASGVMIARGAMWNPSVFRRPAASSADSSDAAGPSFGASMLPVCDVVRRYLALARDTEHMFANSKYTLLELLKGQVGTSALFRQVTRAKDMAGMEAVLNDPQTGMDSEPALTGVYHVPLQLEERPAYGACSKDSATAVPVELVLASSPTGTHGVAPTSADAPSSSAVAGNGTVVRELTAKQRKYEAKQKRKNRAGRAQEQQQQQQAAAAAAAKEAAGAPAAPASVTLAAPAAPAVATGMDGAPSACASAAATAPSDPASMPTPVPASAPLAPPAASA